MHFNRRPKRYRPAGLPVRGASFVTTSEHGATRSTRVYLANRFCNLNEAAGTAHPLATQVGIDIRGKAGRLSMLHRDQRLPLFF